MEMQTGQVRERAVALIQEAATLLGMIPQLLDRNEELQRNLDSASKEAEGLRREVTAVTGEAQQLRVEREEVADTLTVFMNDILRLTNETAAKLRPAEKRSAFSRDVNAPTADSAQCRPGVPAGSPWRRDG